MNGGEIREGLNAVRSEEAETLARGYVAAGGELQCLGGGVDLEAAFRLELHSLAGLVTDVTVPVTSCAQDVWELKIEAARHLGVSPKRVRLFWRGAFLDEGALKEVGHADASERCVTVIVTSVHVRSY